MSVASSTRAAARGRGVPSAHVAMFSDVDDGRIRGQRSYDCIEPLEAGDDMSGGTRSNPVDRGDAPDA